jgi:aryl-alcohol dehydrogenase-like predicted oxidoreductase
MPKFPSLLLSMLMPMLLIVVGCLSPSKAFQLASPLQGITVKQHDISGTTRRWSTPPGPSGSDGGGDDEVLSKLIDKRSAIKRKKKPEDPLLEQLQQPFTAQDWEKPMELPTADGSSGEPLDLESMPQFKVPRPVRKSKQEEAADAAVAASGSQESKPDEDILSVDFLSEYKDENDFHVPNRLGFSTSGWGDPAQGFVAEGKLSKRMAKAGMYVAGDCQVVYNKLLQAGISLIETSSEHGKASRKQNLSAHDILARCVADYKTDATTPSLVESLPSSWLPPRPSAMRATAERSCERLKVDAVDIVQATKRIPLLAPIIASGLLQVVEAGSCNFVGVVGILQRSSLRRFADAVENRGGSLTSNAFEFSLTNLKNEAMIDHCKEMGVIPLILNPLDGGLASGVYTASNPNGGEVNGNAKFKFERLEKLQPLHSVLETVAERARTRVTREQRDLKERYRSKYGTPVSTAFPFSVVLCCVSTTSVRAATQLYQFLNLCVTAKGQH